MALKKSTVAREEGNRVSGPRGAAERLVAALPFALTKAQKRVIDEIQHDMAVPHPMHRLVQGDVGSGRRSSRCTPPPSRSRTTTKGADGADGAPRRAALGDDPPPRRGGRPAGHAAHRRRHRQAPRPHERAIARGDIDLVIGTHALIQERVESTGSGRHHRRAAPLRRHAAGDAETPRHQSRHSPHDATPIPRTLALTL